MCLRPAIKYIYIKAIKSKRTMQCNHFQRPHTLEGEEVDLSNDQKINFRLRYEYTQLITVSQRLRGSHSNDLSTRADKYTMTIQTVCTGQYPIFKF